jgi:hypothetical protein
LCGSRAFPLRLPPFYPRLQASLCMAVTMVITACARVGSRFGVVVMAFTYCASAAEKLVHTSWAPWL